MAQYIPTPLFSIWHRIPRFFVVDAAPVLSSSAPVFDKASALFSSSTGNSNSQEPTLQERNRQKLATDYDVPIELQLELEPLRVEKIFEGNTVGANSEALQCLRKGEGWSWGACDDYSVFVRELVDAERQKQQLDTNPESHAKLKIRAYFAESDIMIGSGGQKYVEECWGLTEGTFGDVIDFDSVTMPGTDHESVVQSMEVLEKLFTDVTGNRAY